ncbi:hypothetical protein TCAL_01020 [Tigriopus californicus]|uniref:Thyroglobulin type-1 domain-containing protein n=1 Tax=Tigriopus californicus TaxID=6832 RepID=A0A553P431_TIGCA|nr:uncharacterized protein LOC131884313 [Tigriopus californicus]TRY72455.1 hypothetical protein TCAL_01020 [Tigriopus californicus]
MKFLIFVGVSSFLLELGLCANWPSCTESGANVHCTLPICPNCKIVDCIPELEPKDCPRGTFFEENLVLGSCCPACVEYLKKGDKCFYSPTTTNVSLYENTVPLQCHPNKERVVELSIIRYKNKDIPLVKRNQCPDQHECLDGICQIEDAAAAVEGCLKATLEYDSWLNGLNGEECSELKWEPSCTFYGAYDNVQSKTNVFQPVNSKFCSAPDGTRIFGQATIEAEADEINCRCSRKRWELEKEILSIGARDDVTLHCERNGDFEPLQCDLERCWCINPVTGVALSRALPEKMAMALPCYDKELFGDQYLRRCETRSLGKAKSRKKLRDHGFYWLESMGVTCDWDGSFGKVYCDKSSGQCKCVDKNNQQIGNYFTTMLNKDDLNCQCARDELEGLTQLNCGSGSSAGNYLELQSLLTTEYCVDESGFRFTPYYLKTSGKFCQIPNCPSRVKQCQGDEGNVCDECLSSCSGI